ncbi:MAG: TolC family protein [Halanaerobiales bacterium]|nr:TolC family protein [Halanaerobiales bacterium]
MKQFTKMFFILVVLVAISITSFASDLKVVNLEEALKMVFENNIDLKIANLTLANSKIDWEKNQLSSNADTRSQQLNLQLELAKNEDVYHQAQYNIVYGVINNFIELTQKRLTVELNKNQLQIKELDLTRITELYKKGSAKTSELMDARSAVESQKLTLHRSQEDYDKLIDTLMTKTGLEGEVEFSELDITIKALEINFQTALEKAQSISFNLKDKEIRHQLANLEVEKAKVEGKPELDLNKYVNNKEIAWYRYLQAKDDLSETIKDQLWASDQALKTIEVKSVELDIAKENAKLTEIGYNQGFYTETQVLQSTVSLLNAEKTLFSAQADYILKTIQLYHQIGEDERIGGDLR